MARTKKQRRLARSASEIIDRIKSLYGHTTDQDAAKLLGVKRNTLSTWRTRNSVDYSLIVDQCDRVDLNWLFRGEEYNPDLTAPAVRESNPVYQAEYIASLEEENKVLKAQKEELESLIMKMSGKKK